MAGETIFVVDDSRTLREHVALMLRQCGGTPIVYAGAPQCLPEIQRHHPDLILMDYHMAPMRGDECCQFIKETPDLARVPIVMMTAEWASDEVMRSWKAGADDFLPKPIRKYQLESKVEAVRSTLEETVSPRLERRFPQKLLFVEKSHFFRRSIGGSLEQAGYQVLYAGDAAEALKLIDRSAEPMDAVIIDVSGPGLDLMRELKNDPTLGDKPFVATSPEPESQDVHNEVAEITDGWVIDKSRVPSETVLSQIMARLLRGVSDTRRAKRVPFFSIAEFRRKGDADLLSGYMRDISASGGMVRTITPLPAGTEIELKVKFTEMKEHIIFNGWVAWSNTRPPERRFSNPIGMGIQFGTLTPEQQTRITQTVTIAEIAPIS